MRLLNVLLLALGLILSISVSHAEEKLILAGGGDENDPLDNISKEVLIEAYRKIGVDVRFLTLPPARALIMSNEGQLDGEMHRIKGIDKHFKNLVMVSIPINRIEVVVFTKKKAMNINRMSDLKPYLIGIKIGVKFAEEITQKMNVHKVVREEQLFKMLNNNRLDAVLSVHLVGLQTIRKLKFKRIYDLKPPLVTKKLYHYLHKKHQDIVPRITKSLKEMEKENSIQEIYKQRITELSE